MRFAKEEVTDPVAKEVQKLRSWSLMMYLEGMMLMLNSKLVTEQQPNDCVSVFQMVQSIVERQ